MEDNTKTIALLNKELSEMRHRVAELESLETQHKQAEEALQRSQEHFQALIENSFDTTLILNDDGSLCYINPSVERPLGWDPEELIGRVVFDLVHPDNLQDVTNSFLEAIKTPGSVTFLETRVKAKDGSWHTTECRGKNLLDNPSVAGVVVNLRDITKHKIVEEELERSNKYHQALTENSFDTIIIMNGDGSIRYATPSITRLLGYGPEERIGSSVLDFIHPDSLEKVNDAFNEGDQVPDYSTFLELKVMHKDGSWRTTECIASNLLDHPAVAGIVVNLRDITDRKEAEEALQRSQEYYQALLENSYDTTIIMNVDGSIRYASPSIERAFGFEPDEIIGQNVFEFAHPDDMQDMIDRLANQIQNGEHVGFVQIRAKHKDGSWRFVEGAGTNLLDHLAVKGIIANFHDITDRKLAEDALKSSKEYYQTIIENSYDTTAIINADGSIRSISPSIKRPFGYDPDDMIDKSVFDLIHPEDLSNAIDLLNAAPSNPGDIASVELRARRQDGSWLTVECMGISLLDNPAIEGIVINLRDITDRKEAEEELKALYQQETKLREALEEERRRRIEFTRVLVHELKTPLTPVLAASSLLLDEVRDETLARLSRSISKGALNLSNRIDDLLDIVKGEIGMLNLEFQSVDLLPLFHKVADSIAPMASSNGHSLILDLPPSLPLVQADENRLQQVILNLINNASKFTPSGGTITLRARENGTALIVEVQDTGKGISEDEQQRLFDPYYRVESDRQQLSGLGLGLAVCKTLIELHRGQIWVESRLGEGSTFGFSLPFEG